MGSEHGRARWLEVAAIALGGAIGAIARHGIGTAVPVAPGGWPWATLLVNLSGCALVGALMVLVTEVRAAHRLTRPFLGVGVLGGYTTFSTFALDVVSLSDAGVPALGLGYLAATTVGALVAVTAAVAATRTLCGLRPGWSR